MTMGVSSTDPKRPVTAKPTRRLAERAWRSRDHKLARIFSMTIALIGSFVGLPPQYVMGAALVWAVLEAARD